MTPLTFLAGIVTALLLGWLGYAVMELAGVLVVRLVKRTEGGR